MEWICGKRTWSLDAAQFQARLAGCKEILLDLGTGDGRFVLAQVRRSPEIFGIGLDACRENLLESSRKNPARTLFLIANALDMPVELTGTISLLTLNFPWGSLLEGLLSGEEVLLEGMARVCAANARWEVRLNQSAVKEAGSNLEDAGQKVYRELTRAGFKVRSLETLDGSRLRTCPTTWARKMAYGRDPQGLILRGVYR